MVRKPRLTHNFSLDSITFLTIIFFFWGGGAHTNIKGHSQKRYKVAPLVRKCILLQTHIISQECDAARRVWVMSRVRDPQCREGAANPSPRVDTNINDTAFTAISRRNNGLLIAAPLQ